MDARTPQRPNRRTKRPSFRIRRTFPWAPQYYMTKRLKDIIFCPCKGTKFLDPLRAIASTSAARNRPPGGSSPLAAPLRQQEPRPTSAASPDGQSPDSPNARRLSFAEQTHDTTNLA